MVRDLAKVNVNIDQSGSVMIGNRKFSSKQEAFALLSTITIRAGRQAARKTVTQYEPTVAQKTGALRDGYAAELTQAFNNAISRSKNLSIRMNRADIRQFLVNATDYAEHHIDGAPKTGASTYKNPTTPGTKPIDTGEILDIFVDNFVSARAGLLRSNRLV